MRTSSFLAGLLGLAFLASAALSAQAAELPLREHSKGSPNAPITVVEYSSLTCSHCAQFANDVLPELEKRYVDTGKVRFIFRAFAGNRIDLKGVALASCLPEEQYLPYLTLLFKTQGTWLREAKPEETLVGYARMAGLTPERAKSCAEDDKLLDAIVAQRTEAIEKYNIQATPTFIINGGEERIMGSMPVETFAATFDRLLAAKKK